MIRLPFNGQGFLLRKQACILPVQGKNICEELFPCSVSLLSNKLADGQLSKCSQSFERSHVFTFYLAIKIKYGIFGGQ